MNREEAIKQHLTNTHVFVRDQDEHGVACVRELTADTCRGALQVAYYDRVITRVGEQLAALPDKVLIATAEGKLFDGEQAKNPLAILVFEGDERGLSLQEKRKIYTEDYLHDPVRSESEKPRGAVGGFMKKILPRLGMEYDKGSQWISNDIWDVTKRLAPEWKNAKGIIVINNKQQNISEAAKSIEYKPVIGQMVEAYMDSIPSAERSQMVKALVEAMRYDMREGIKPGIYSASLANGDANVNVSIQNNAERQQQVFMRADLSGMVPVAVQALCGGVTVAGAQPFVWEKCPNILSNLLTRFPDLLPTAKHVAPNFGKEWEEGLESKHKQDIKNRQSSPSWAEKTSVPGASPAR